VIDHCQSLLTVFDSGSPGGSYNVKGGAEQQNIEAVNTLCDLLDARLNRKGEHSSRNLIQFVKDRPSDDRRYAIDAS